MSTSLSTLKKSLESLQTQFREASKTWPYNAKRKGRTLYEGLPIVEEHIFKHDNTKESMESALRRGQRELDSLHNLLNDKYLEKYTLNFDYTPSYLKDFKDKPDIDLELLSNEFQNRKEPGMWVQQIPKLKRWLALKLGVADDQADNIENVQKSENKNTTDK